MAREEISLLDRLKSMVLCAAWGVVDTGESAGCLLWTLRVSAEGIRLDLSLIVGLQCGVLS